MFNFCSLGEVRAEVRVGTGLSRFESQLKHLVPELSRWRSGFSSRSSGEDFQVRTQGLVHGKPSASVTCFFPGKQPKSSFTLG